MIVKLTVDQISVFWPMFKFATLQVNQIPKGTQEEFTNNVLSKMLAGEMQAWVGFDSDTEMIKPFGLLITAIGNDLVYGFKFLRIDTVFGITNFDDIRLVDEFKVVEEFGRSQGCKYVQTIADHPRVMEILDRINFNQTPLRIYRKELCQQ